MRIIRKLIMGDVFYALVVQKNDLFYLVRFLQLDRRN
jgi:hypothetical protein